MFGKEKKKQKQTYSKFRKIRRIILYIFLGLFILATGFTVIKVYPLYEETRVKMYDVLTNMDESTFKRTGNTEIYDASGELIGRLGNEYYKYVGITDISEYLTNGYIAEEDKRFPVHHGVDWRATFRAAIALVLNRGEITQGGSTITQQVVKNNLLTQDQTYERKVSEILLARQIEKQYNKSQIMEFYCNSCYYGENCYGVEAACQFYFGHSAKKVSLAEAAMLVGVSNSPSTNNPVVNYSAANKKKKEVLANMLEEGYITEEEYNDACDEKPEIIEQSESVCADSYQITYALHCATLKKMELDGFEFKYTFATSKEETKYEKKYDKVYAKTMIEIRNGGYTIYTSLDSKVQKKLQKSVDSELSQFTEKQDDGRYAMQGAAVCIDNKTQMVVAIVGGRGTEESYNRGYQAERQPGSTIKPLLDYGPALNEGVITPGTVENDAEITVDGYTPTNATNSYMGSVTCREALARSLNTVAFQVFYDTGSDTALSYLDKLKFTSLTYADSTALSISIGGFTEGCTVVDMAKGYATIADGGVYYENNCLTKLVSTTEGTLYKYKKKTADKTRVYSKDTAFILSNMMQGVFRESYGTANYAYSNGQLDGQIYAGKTGTTNDDKDAWFCGFSSYYTTAVWTGYDSPKEIENLYQNSYPLHIWADFMEEMHENLEKKDFVMPDSIVLTDSNGNTKEVSDTDDDYADRPYGWDYMSENLSEIVEDHSEENRIKEQTEEAEEALNEFEDYQITDAASALAFKETYNTLLETLDAMEDEEKKVEFKKRAAYKYELLSGEVLDKWQDAAEEQAAAEQKIEDAENEAQAQYALEQAYAAEKAAKISVVQWYINQLNSRTLYTDNVAKMINEAREALADVADYDEYSQLEKDLESAINYANKLPSKKSDD